MVRPPLPWLSGLSPVASRNRLSRVVRGWPERTTRGTVGGGLRRQGVDQAGWRVVEDDFDLVFDGDEVVQHAFADHAAAGQDADAVADFLDLFEQVGREDDGFAEAS